jgi:hypothetical protein
MFDTDAARLAFGHWNNGVAEDGVPVLCRYQAVELSDHALRTLTAISSVFATSQ